jgi:hypothetical protein
MYFLHGRHVGICRQEALALNFVQFSAKSDAFRSHSWSLRVSIFFPQTWLIHGQMDADGAARILVLLAAAVF